MTCHPMVARTSMMMTTAMRTWMKMLFDELANAAGQDGIDLS